MAGLKCTNCKRYDKANGCEFEIDNYPKYRDCVLGNRDYSVPIVAMPEKSDGAVIVHLPDEFPTLAEIMEQQRKAKEK